MTHYNIFREFKPNNFEQLKKRMGEENIKYIENIVDEALTIDEVKTVIDKTITKYPTIPEWVPKWLAKKIAYETNEYIDRKIDEKLGRGANESEDLLKYSMYIGQYKILDLIKSTLKIDVAIEKEESTTTTTIF